MPSNLLREMQAEYYAKVDTMDRIFAQAKQADGRFDFLQAEAFQHLSDQKTCLEKIDQLEAELKDLNGKIQTQEGLEEHERRMKERRTQMQTIVEPMIHSNGSGNGHNGSQGVQVKGLSDYVRETYPRDAKANGG